MKIHVNTFPDNQEYANALKAAGAMDGEWLTISRQDLRKVLAVHAPERLKEFPGLGDLVSKAVKPIARAMQSPCLDGLTGNLRPASTCDEKRKRLNELGGKLGL